MSLLDRTATRATLETEWPGMPIRDQLLDALEQCVLHDDGTPDAFTADSICGAWVKAPRIIGGPSHTHVCRRDPDHREDHRPTHDQPHHCICGHDW